MAQEGKKISFGFSKTIKKPDLKPLAPVVEKKVDYIECVDDKSIKIIGLEEKKDEPLIIPMLGSKSWHDRIINKINVDIYGEKASKDKIAKELIEVKKEETEEGSKDKNDNEDTDTKATEESINDKKPEESSKSALSLEDQAAQEIINELSKVEKTQENGANLMIEQNTNLAGEKESTLENYEEIPIEKFGIAMLRGMGWKPGEGIGKNAQLVTAAVPTLRPKGIGLGADKVMQQNKVSRQETKNDEKLILKKGSYVKVIAGNYNGNYGIVEGFDDDTGRTIVKLSLINKVVSLNEYIIEVVAKNQYEKNSRVLNASKYEKYKDKITGKDESKEKNKTSLSSESEENDEINSSRKIKNHKTSRKKDRRSREREKYSSDSEDDVSSDIDEKSRRNKSTDRRDEYKTKKSSKKHRHRDHSESRKSKKSHKKEKKRDKSDNYKEDKKKHRKHKRSRSRSRSRSGRR